MIRDSWRSIERAINSDPEAAQDLLGGATRDDIRHAEEKLGVEFPDDFVESYLLHDGQGPAGLFIMGDLRLWSLSAILADDCDPVIRKRTPPLVGIADNGGNTVAYIDVGSGETRGRILELCDGCEAQAWPSLGALLANIASQFDTGKLVWNPDSGSFATPVEIAAAAAEGARDAKWYSAFDAGPDLETLKRESVGAEMEIIGLRAPGESGSSSDALRISGGIVQLRGSLRGANTFAPIRVRIRIESRRWLGLLSPIHTMIGWEPFEPAAQQGVEPDVE
jgi:hypothetical protein